MTERNTDLFFDVADMVDAHPQWYDQTTYGCNVVHMKGTRGRDRRTVESCGATHCIAGWATVLSGRAVWNQKEHDFVSAHSPRIVDAHEGGRKALGLTATEAEWLFDGEWTPRKDITVGDALRLIGKGEAISVVSSLDFHEWDPDMTKSLLKSEKQRGLL